MKVKKKELKRKKYNNEKGVYGSTMKANNGIGNNPERDLWETQQSFWNKLDLQYTFEYDCCASLKNRKTHFFSDDFRSLGNLTEMAWMNPPFSKAKEMFEHFFKVVKQGVAIYRCYNMETRIWQEIIFPNATWIFIPKGRISYTPFETGDMRKGMGTRFPSALIGINTNPPKNIEGTTINTILHTFI